MLKINDKILRKILASVLAFIMLFGNISPVFLAQTEYEPTPAQLQTTEAVTAQKSSLKALAAQGVIKPDYLIKEELIAAAGNSKSTSFASRLAMLMAGSTGEGEGLFQDLDGLTRIRNLLRESDSKGGVINTPADLGALDFVRVQIATKIGEGVLAGRDFETLVSDITLIIDNLVPREVAEVNLNPSSALQATWTEENKVILRWQPEGSWIPENGYNLYRVIGNNVTLLAEGLGLEENDYGEPNVSIGYNQLLTSAKFDAEKLKHVGILNENQLNKILYTEDSKVANLNIIRSPLYYEEYKQGQLVLKNGSDYSLSDLKKEVVLSGQVVAQQINQAKLADLSIQEPRSQAEDLAEVADPVEEIKMARSMIKAQANFDFEFAEASGLAFIDNLRGLSLSEAEEVSYVLLPLTQGERGYEVKTLAGRIYRYNREWGLVSDPNYQKSINYSPQGDENLIVAVPKIGVETKPQAPTSLEGFGINNKVSMRWQVPQDETQLGMISGYNIYRQGGKVVNFTQINDTPITVPFVTMEKGDLTGTFEGPIFFVDEKAKNGETYTYKVQSIDIYGRKSELSESFLQVTVIKTELPDVPLLESPYLSTLVRAGEAPQWVVNAVKRITSPSVILPISATSVDGKTSEDAVLFNIYRSEAYGKNSYGVPVLLDTINAVDKVAKNVTYRNEHGIEVLDAERLPGVYYVDNNVVPGYNYRYWVSTLDSWGNESSWTMPVSIDYASKTAPGSVNFLETTLTKNIRLEGIGFVPGFGEERIISNAKEKEYKSLLTGEVDLLLPQPTNNLGSGLVNATPLSVLGNVVNTTELSNVASGMQINNFPSSLQSSKAFQAIKEMSDYGLSLTKASVLHGADLPHTLKAEFLNLPTPEQILHIIAYGKNDISSNGKLEVSWYPYQGLNLKHYVVYRGLVKNKSLDYLNSLDKSALLYYINSFELIADEEMALTEPQLIDHPPALATNNLYVYLIIPIPQNANKLVGYDSLKDTDRSNAYGAWVKLNWGVPNNSPLVDFYRIYKAEAPNLSGLTTADYAKLNYTLLHDRVTYTSCVDSVEQSVGHNYVYKVVAISLWGVEGPAMYSAIRVPSTIPPAEPEMLLPNSRPGSVEIKFTAVTGATKYNIYRTTIETPNLQELNKFEILPNTMAEGLERIYDVMVQERILVNKLDINILGDRNHQPPLNIPNIPNFNLFALPGQIEMPEFGIPVTGIKDFVEETNLFSDYSKNTDSNKESLTKRIKDLTSSAGNRIDLEEKTAIQGSQVARDFYDEGLLKYSTLFSSKTLLQDIQNNTLQQKRSAIQQIIDDYGILSVVSYANLNYDVASTIEWDKVGTVVADTQTEPGQPVEFTDRSTVFGKKYLYTVSAANEDLESSRPEPIEASCLKGEPFSEPPNLAVVTKTIANEQSEMIWVNHLTWKHVTSPYFSQEELIKNWIAGYIVYRSNLSDGPYHQISGIVSETEFSDATANPFQGYYYRVKTADTAGFITNFDLADGGGLYVAPRLIATALIPGGLTGQSISMPDRAKATVNGISNIISYFYNHNYDPDMLNFYNFTKYLKDNSVTELKFTEYKIKDINLNSLSLDTFSGHSEYPYAIFGSGNLTLGPTQTKIPVNFVIRNVNYIYKGVDNLPYDIYDGEISLAYNLYTQPDTGMIFDAVDLRLESYRRIEGYGNQIHFEYIVDTISEITASYSYQNSFFGDTDVIVLNKATLSGEGIIRSTRVPVFHWQDFVFYDIASMEFDLNSMNKNSTLALSTPRFPVTFYNGQAENSLAAPTIDNKGLEFTFNKLGLIPGSSSTTFAPLRRNTQVQAISGIMVTQGVNLTGNLTGIYGTLQSKADSYAQFAAPMGIAFKMMTGKVNLGGSKVVSQTSNLGGQVVLPFFEATADLADGLVIDRVKNTNQGRGNALLLSLFVGDDAEAEVVLNQVILNLFDEAIKNKSILIDGRYLDLSHVDCQINAWDGKGFVINNKTLSPVLVGNYDIRGALYDERDVQKLGLMVEQSFVVRSEDIGIDLSDTKKLPNMPLDKWYSDVDWKGIVLNEGSISLSRAVMTFPQDTPDQAAESITFKLAPREMIYDRNGFYYYNKLEPEEPIAVEFGVGFGSFKNVEFSYLEVDMYANKFDLWIYGSVEIPAFGNQSVDFSMETDEDNIIRALIMPASLSLADPILGPDNKMINPIELNIFGGFFNRRGANIEGSFKFNLPGQLTEDVTFCELVVPHDVWEMSVKRSDLAPGETLTKGTAQLEKPYRTRFNGYVTELRSLDLYAQRNLKSGGYDMGIYLSGGAALTGNTNMPDHNNARFYISNINEQAEVVLSEAVVHVTMALGGGGGMMSGEMVAAGAQERVQKDEKREEEKEEGLNEYVGKNSPAYLNLKAAQEANSEALAVAGKVEEIKTKIDTAIAEINLALGDMDAFNARIEGEIKSGLLGAVEQIQSQRLQAKALVMNNTRVGIDTANANINMVNRQINSLNVYINEYADIKPENKEFYEQGAFPTVKNFNKKAVVEHVDYFTTELFDSENLQKTEAQIRAEINAFKLDLFTGIDLSSYQIPFSTDDLYITAVIGPATEILEESMKRLDEVVTYYEEANKYIDQLDKYITGTAYPGFTIGDNGIVEFNPKNDAFCLTLLKEANFLEGSKVQIEGRLGWKADGMGSVEAGADKIDPDLFFYAFALAYIPTPEENEKPQGIKMGSMELQNLVGITAYNFIPPYTQGSGYTLGTGTAMLSSIATLEIDITNKGDSFFAVSADMYVKSTTAKHLFAIKDMMLFVSSDGSFQVSGSMFGPKEISMLSKAGPNNSTTLYGRARLTYNAPHDAFEFRASIVDLHIAPGFIIAGTLGFDWGPKHWVLYLGYPETLKLTYTPWSLTGGFGLNLGVNPVTGNPIIKVKLDIGYSDRFEFSIVYAKVSAYAMVLIGYGPWNMLEGEDEMRWFNNGQAFEGFAAGGRLMGEVVGGIVIPGGRTFDIIRLALDSHLFVVNPREDYTYLQDRSGYYYYESTKDAQGNLKPDLGKWYLDAKIKITYHLDLWIVTFSDSFSYHYKTSFSMT